MFQSYRCKDCAKIAAETTAAEQNALDFTALALNGRTGSGSGFTLAAHPAVCMRTRFPAPPMIKL